MAWKRITKRQAFKLFAAGKPVWFVPCKLRIGSPWNPECKIELTAEFRERANWYNPAGVPGLSYKPLETNPGLWKETTEQTAWDLIYNDWAYYNTSWETGYYAHYYIQE